MNLLNPRPKSNKDEFYGRAEQLESLLEYIEKKEPLVIVSGLRRIGKTSLVKTALSTVENGIFVDAFQLGSMKTTNKQEILNLFKHSIQLFLDNNQSKKDQMLKIFKSLRISVGISGASIHFQQPPDTAYDIVALFNALNEWGINNGETIVLAIDEAQEFAKATDIDMGRVFSAFYSYDNVVLILTGSKIGLLHDFVQKDDSQGAFYGRSRRELVLDPLTFEASKDFLTKALTQAGLNTKDRTCDEILIRVVNELGGIIGWLVRFGRVCEEHKEVRSEFIEPIQKEGSRQIKKELYDFLNRNNLQKSKYENLLDKLSSINIPYSSFEQYLKDRKMTTCAKKLTDEGFLRIDDKRRYHLADPLIAYAFRNNDRNDL